MDSSNIKKYAELMQETGLTGLEIKENDTFLRLERNIPAQQIVLPQDLTAMQPQAAMPVQQTGEQAAARQSVQSAQSAQPAQNGAEADDDIKIVSPMVGVFHAASEEGGAPLVKVGDQISKGDTVCIIEAMKLMNELVAEEEGTLDEICVEDGQIVEYGTVLFRIRK